LLPVTLALLFIRPFPLRPLFHYFILLVECVVYLRFATLDRIIISHTESLSFSLTSTTLTLSFSDDATYDLAMMEKMN
jgi:hypothetical protein